MRFKIVLVAIFTLAVSGLFAAPAASGQAPPGTRAAAGIQAIGQPAAVHAFQKMYQCPGVNCNQGQAYPGNDLRALCYWPAVNPQWVWTVNLSNGHTGFIGIAQIAPDGREPCDSTGRATRVKLWGNSLFQCAGEFCNQGVANPDDDVTTMCDWGFAGGRIPLEPCAQPRQRPCRFHQHAVVDRDLFHQLFRLEPFGWRPWPAPARNSVTARGSVCCSPDPGYRQDDDGARAHP